MLSNCSQGIFSISSPEIFFSLCSRECPGHSHGDTPGTAPVTLTGMGYIYPVPFPMMLPRVTQWRRDFPAVIEEKVNQALPGPKFWEGGAGTFPSPGWSWIQSSLTFLPRFPQHLLQPRDKSLSEPHPDRECPFHLGNDALSFQGNSALAGLGECSQLWALFLFSQLFPGSGMSRTSVEPWLFQPHLWVCSRALGCSWWIPSWASPGNECG